MKIKEIEISKLKELKEKSKMLKDERQKGKVVYKIWDIVVVVILLVLSDCNEWEEIEDYAKEQKDFLKISYHLMERQIKEVREKKGILQKITLTKIDY